MGFRQYNLSASLNTTVGGISVAEGMDRADVNNAMRVIMADAARFAQGQALSVIEHSAVGDGTTNDTTAIQNALTAAGTAKCDLYIPGTGNYYKITASLTVPDGVRVFGAGWLKQVTRGQNLFVAGTDNTFEGLHLQGDGIIGSGTSGVENIGIYANGERNLTVKGCMIHGFEGGGIMARNCFGVHVEGNLFYGNDWDGVAGGGSLDASDILISSNTAGGGSRYLIRGNQCYSNNSQNIYFSPVGLDHDAIIEGNICDTLDSDFDPVASGGVKRHSIIAGYSSFEERRVIVCGNICRNTRQTGIYFNFSADETGPALIEGNLCIGNGYDTGVSDIIGAVYASPTGRCPVIIRGNYCLDLQHNQGGAFTLASGHGIIEGNVSVGSGCNGIAIINNADSAIVRGNTIRTSAGVDIRVELVNGNTANSGILIENNDIERTTAAAMIRSILGSGYTGRCVIRNNTLRGPGLAGGLNSDANIGIAIQSPITSHDIIGNKIQDVKWGVNSYTAMTAARYHSECRWDANEFRNCGSGSGAAWGVGAATTAGVMPVEGNTYVNCNASHGIGTVGTQPITYDAVREATVLQVYGFTAKPGVGTFIAGDRVRFTAPAAAGNPGANCTTGGNPGTWKYWAALEA